MFVDDGFFLEFSLNLNSFVDMPSCVPCLRLVCFACFLARSPSTVLSSVYSAVVRRESVSFSVM